MPKAQTPSRISLQKKDWAATLKAAKSVSTLPDGGIRVLFVPNPDGGADGFPFCHEQGPDTTCQVRSSLQPDGSLSFECRCKSTSPGGPGPSPGGGPTIKPCLLRSSPQLGCLKLGCKGKCELVIAEKPVFGKILYFASCRCSKA
jgi:hypothetical protein